MGRGRRLRSPRDPTRMAGGVLATPLPAGLHRPGRWLCVPASRRACPYSGWNFALCRRIPSTCRCRSGARGKARLGDYCFITDTYPFGTGYVRSHEPIAISAWCPSSGDPIGRRWFANQFPRTIADHSPLLKLLRPCQCAFAALRRT
jgi:hypothetical protein